MLALQAEPKLRGRELGEYLDRLEAEIDNIRSALAWAKETGQIEAGLQVASSLLWFWNLRGYQAEGQEWLQSLLMQPTTAGNAETRLSALQSLALTTSRRGEQETARRLYAEAQTLARELNDQPDLAGSYLGLGTVAMGMGDYALAQTMYDQSIAVWRALGNEQQALIVTVWIGILAILQEDYARAAQVLENTVGALRHLENKNNLSFANRWWGYALMFLGNHTAAAAKFRESLTVNLELADRQAVAACLNAFGVLAAERQDYQRAGVLLAAAEQTYLSIQMTLLPFDQQFHDRYTRSLRTQLDAPALAAAAAEGRALTLQQAIALAVAEIQRAA
jgi:tetratricopeptide (TPR) repeat protein